MHDLVIIGGGAAGLTAALTARKVNWNANITLISDEELHYSPCALPFVIAGEIDGFDKISESLVKICEENDIECIIDKAIDIDVVDKLVETEKGERLEYTSLILATGAKPIIPRINGIEKRGIFTLKTLEDAKRIDEYIEKCKRALVVGGSAIGVEIAVALKKRGLDVTLVEICDRLFSRAFDRDFSEEIEKKLRDNGIRILTNSKVKSFFGENRVRGAEIIIQDKEPMELETDMVVLGTGVRANIELAEKAGLKIEHNAIKVNGLMATSVKNIFAAGDCTHSLSLVTSKPMLSQLGTTAIRQGKVAGTNAVGGYATMEGVLNSLIVKIFDLEVGRTGLTEEDCKYEEIETIVGKAKTTTRAEYFPNSKEIKIKLIFNALNRRLVGAQVVGYGNKVSGMIDLLAFAIQRYAKIEELKNLKYCYTPPLSPAEHGIVTAAENAHRKLMRYIESRKRSF